jgi:hypothetical protein
VNLLGGLVPAMAQILNQQMDNKQWGIHSTICQVLAELGPHAQLAVPALLEHTEQNPRFELNAWALGRIGGPGVVRRLLQWTYFQGERHDRKRTDSVCGAMESLGESAIQELLELTNSDSVHERTSAILNLVNNTTCPLEKTLSLLVAELDRNCNCQCNELLRDELIRLGRDHQECVVQEIELCLLANSPAGKNYVEVLSHLGVSAVPTLIKAIELDIEICEAVSALAATGSEGLEYLYRAILVSDNHLLAVCAIYNIPSSGLRSFEILKSAIACRKDEFVSLRMLSIERLGEFNDLRDQIIEFLSSLTNDADEKVSDFANQTSNKLKH